MKEFRKNGMKIRIRRRIPDSMDFDDQGEVIQRITELSGFFDHKSSMLALQIYLDDYAKCEKCPGLLEVCEALVFTPNTIYLLSKGWATQAFSKDKWARLECESLSIPEGFHFVIHAFCILCHAHRIQIFTGSPDRTFFKALKEWTTILPSFKESLDSPSPQILYEFSSERITTLKDAAERELEGI